MDRVHSPAMVKNAFSAVRSVDVTIQLVCQGPNDPPCEVVAPIRDIPLLVAAPRRVIRQN
jgi:hypothetical protein